MSTTGGGVGSLQGVVMDNMTLYETNPPNISNVTNQSSNPIN
jgi:hypothetical protein